MARLDPVTAMLLLLAWRDGQRPQARRKPGTGSVRRVVDKARDRVVYRVRYRAKDYESFSVRLSLPPAERERAEADAKAQAEHALDERRRRVDAGDESTLSAERRTLAQATAAFLEEVRDLRGESHATYLAYRDQCRHITDAPVARVELRDLRRAHVAAWVGWLKKNATPGQAANAFTRLVQVLNREVQDVTNLRGVLDARKALRPGYQPESVPPFSPKETAAILRAARQHPTVQGVPIGPICAVCLYAKARIGEACGLRWRDVGFFDDTLTIAKQVIHGTTRLEDVKGKRAAAIPVDHDLIEWLTEWRRRAERPCMPDDLVFQDERASGRRAPGPANGAVTYSRARKAFEALLALADVDAAGATHRLRKASATMSVREGTPLAVVQRQLRHKDIRTTMVYVGVDEEMAREDASRVGKRLRGG